MPPDLVSFREKGSRRQYTAKAGWIMQKIIEHDLPGKAKREANRGLLGAGRHA
jgi:hypothetical protein